MPLSNGTMRAEHNQRKERDHDTAQSLRPSPRRFQGEPLGSGALRQPLHRLRLRDGQTTRLGMAGERTARSEEHTSELQSLMRNSYAVLCLKKKTQQTKEDK